MRIPDPSRPLPLLLGSCHAKANTNVNVRADVTVHIRLALDASMLQSLDTLEPLFVHSIPFLHPIPFHKPQHPVHRPDYLNLNE